jgi:hypothetical protein
MKRNETRATEIDKVNLALLSGYVIAKNYGSVEFRMGNRRVLRSEAL